MLDALATKLEHYMDLLTKRQQLVTANIANIRFAMPLLFTQPSRALACSTRWTNGSARNRRAPATFACL